MMSDKLPKTVVTFFSYTKGKAYGVGMRRAVWSTFKRNLC